MVDAAHIMAGTDHRTMDACHTGMVIANNVIRNANGSAHSVMRIVQRVVYAAKHASITHTGTTCVYTDDIIVYTRIRHAHTRMYTAYCINYAT